MRSPRLAAILCLAALTGCTSATRRFPGADAARVWDAMVKAAQEPQYPNWKVAGNDVWIDEKERRIQVYRHLRRVYYTPQYDPAPQERTWRFEMRLKDSDPIEVTFTSKGMALPAHAQQEADLYFAELAAALATPGTEPAAASGDDRLLDALGSDL